MNRVRAEAQERDDDDDDDDEESEDSDFNPDAAGGSDVAEEWVNFFWISVLMEYVIFNFIFKGN